VSAVPHCLQDQLTQRYSVFDFTWELDIPPAIVQMTKILLLPQDDWEKARDKGKVPKPKMEPEIMQMLEKVLHRRSSRYRTSIEVRQVPSGSRFYLPAVRRTRLHSKGIRLPILETRSL
jgi:thymidylate synthase ThyX